MGSRLRSPLSVQHWFECYAEVAPPSKNKAAQFIARFPNDWVEFLPKIADFVFPCIMHLSAVQHFSFVLTQADSSFVFGYCRHDPNDTIALVVVSHIPDHDAFYRLLDNIASLRKEIGMSFLHKKDLNVHKRIQEYLRPLYSQPPQPKPYVLPSIPSNGNLTEYFNALDPPMMLQTLAALLHERRIIMTSKRLGRLAACIQSANDLIYPLMWQHIFIPVLPESLLEYLTAPMPYLIGVPDTLCRNVIWRDVGDVVVLDVDSNTFSSPHNDLARLPQKPLSALRSSLTCRDLLGNAVPKAFLTFMVHILGHYRDALRDDGPNLHLDNDFFVESRSRSLRPFLRHLLTLQTVQQFIEERISRIASGSSLSDEFDRACVTTAVGGRTNRNPIPGLLKKITEKTQPAVQSAVQTVQQGSKSAYHGLKSKLGVEHSSARPSGSQNISKTFTISHNALDLIPKNSREIDYSYDLLEDNWSPQSTDKKLDKSALTNLTHSLPITFNVTSDQNLPTANFYLWDESVPAMSVLDSPTAACKVVEDTPGSSQPESSGPIADIYTKTFGSPSTTSSPLIHLNHNNPSNQPSSSFIKDFLSFDKTPLGQDHNIVSSTDLLREYGIDFDKYKQDRSDWTKFE